MRKHTQMRVYTAMLITMVCAVFVLHYSHWGKVRYRQSIARAGRGILPHKHHKHKQRKHSGRDEKQHPVQPGQHKQHLSQPEPNKQHKLHPVPNKQHKPQQYVIHPDKEHLRRIFNFTTPDDKKGRHGKQGKDHSMLETLLYKNRTAPVGERGIKGPLRHHNNYSRRLVVKGDRGKLFAQAAKRGHDRTNLAGNSPHGSRLSLNAKGHRQNDVLSPHLQHRSMSKTVVHAPKLRYLGPTRVVLKTSGLKTLRQ